MTGLNLPILRQLHEASREGECRARWLDLHLAQLLVERGQLSGMEAENLALASALLSYQVGQGEVCLDLRRLPSQPFALADGHPLRQRVAGLTAEDLRGLPGVGAPGELAPLILAGPRLYLHKYWCYEQQVREALETRASQPNRPLTPAQRRLFAELFPQDELNGGSEVDWQAVAVALALLRPLAVITGGPGTGKTRVVTQLLALLQAEQTTADQPVGKPLLIRLVAPTGKAALRLTDSIRRAKQGLPEQLAARIPEQAQTLHRLLGARANGRGFSHGRDNPLHLDVLVLDEASMVDLALMARLLSALPPQARLILLGDADQLASVEAGSVLADIAPRDRPVSYSPMMAQALRELTGYPVPVQADVAAQSVLQDSLCRLRRSYRFSNDLAQVAAAINDQGWDALEAAFRQSQQLVWQPVRADSMNALVAQAVAGYQRYRALVRAGAPPQVVLQAFEQFRVLAALREGPLGVASLNKAIEMALFGRATSWYAGQPLLIQRNDYDLNLFNGDIGVVLECPRRQQLRAYFVQPDGTIQPDGTARPDGVRDIAVSRLPPVEPAFAMTIHKSQGSEFDRVLVVLPDQDHELLTKELLYTGVTRARETCTLVAEPAVLRATLARRTRRASGLRAGLWGSEGDDPAAAGL